MRIYRTFIGVCIAALSLIGYSGFGYAAEPSYALTQTIRYAVADLGSYGEARARSVIEMAYMVSLDSVSSGVGEGLVKMSNGFVQKPLTVGEVAEGTSGSIATSQLS